MRLAIIVEEAHKESRKLSTKPQKDGLQTQYACGLLLTGTWSMRLQKHSDFINTPIGKYILELEKAL